MAFTALLTTLRMVMMIICEIWTMDVGSKGGGTTSNSRRHVPTVRIKFSINSRTLKGWHRQRS